MPHDVTLITTIAAALGFGLVFGFIATRLKLPTLVGYLAEAATKAGVNLTPQTFMERGVATIDGLDSAATYVLATSKRRDGYGGVKYAKWVDGCACFRYETPDVYPV